MAKNDDTRGLPNRIREWRKRRGLTLKAAAPMVGTTFGHLGKLETGERELSQAWMDRIAKAFEISPADLLPVEAGGLSDRERRLIDTYREIPEALRAGIDALAESQQAFRGFPEVVTLTERKAG